MSNKSIPSDWPQQRCGLLSHQAVLSGGHPPEWSATTTSSSSPPAQVPEYARRLSGCALRGVPSTHWIRATGSYKIATVNG